MCLRAEEAALNNFFFFFTDLVHSSHQMIRIFFGNFLSLKPMAEIINLSKIKFVITYIQNKK